MCDPVTLTMTANAVNAFGVATGVSTLGASTALAGAASSSWAATIGTGMSLMTNPVVGVGMSLLGGRQESRAYDYERQRAEYQTKAYKREAEMREVEALQKQNALKQKYLRDRSSNKALLASRGISVASASYKALMEENYNNFMSTSNNMRMADMDQILASKENAYISGLEAREQTKAKKKTGIVSLIKGVQKTQEIFKESGSLFNIGK